MIARYLADTSAWNRSRRVEERWAELIEGGELALCTPVKLELLYSAQGKADYEALEDELRGFPLLELTPAVDVAAAKTQAALAEISSQPTTRQIGVVLRVLS